MSLDFEIAVPVFNCVNWIDDFMESVEAQGSLAWRMIVRDDASTDGTLQKLEDWKLRLGERLVLLPSGRNLGLLGNYDSVLKKTTAPYVMLADPDDVWCPGKAERLLKAIHEAESSNPSSPVAICTDALVIDHKGETLANSYWQWSRANTSGVGNFRRTVLDSPALSSTMIVNRTLLDMALPMHGHASCPDWWLFLVATAFGKAVALPDKTILYRRHWANDSVAPMATSLMDVLRRGVQIPAAAHRRIGGLVRQFAPQATSFQARFEATLSRDQQSALKAAASLPLLGPFQKRRSIISNGLWFGSPVKNAGLLLFC